MKTKLHTIVFTVTLTVSVGLVVAGFLVPPMGIIDRARLATGGTVGSPDAVSELTDFCLWQWQNPCPRPDEP